MIGEQGNVSLEGADLAEQYHSSKYLKRGGAIFSPHVREQMQATRGRYRRQTLFDNIAGLEFK